MRRYMMFLVAAAVGCGQANMGDESFDEAVERFVAAICACDSSTGCEDDVRQDMMDAKSELDADGEVRCIACINTKSAELQKMTEASCDPSVMDEGAVFAACDLDPTTDDDGDGIPDNDHGQACAGYP